MCEYANKISDYIIKTYNIKEDTPYQIETVDAISLLQPNRFDEGAKLYYIRSHDLGQNVKLADKLYDCHIEAFCDGIVAEAGKNDKRGLDVYHEVFNKLIECYRADQFDRNKEWIPVDKNNQILDGAHRLACAVYFGQKLKIVRFPSVNGRRFHFNFFRTRGLEQGYLQLMAGELVSYMKDVSLQKLVSKGAKCRMSCLLKHAKEKGYEVLYAQKAEGAENTYWSLLVHKRQSIGTISTSDAPKKNVEQDRIEALFNNSEKEKMQSIVVTRAEARQHRIIRITRGLYTRCLLTVKKILKRPV